MSYWVRLVTPDREHNEIESMTMSISWNYSNLMLHLPCGWARDWQGKNCKGHAITNPIKHECSY